MMFSSASRESTVERFIGALTMALGVGALVPRAGFGLYALLELNGQRTLWSLLMLTVGCWIIAASYLQAMPRLRIFILTIGLLFWGALILKFVSASLWGAAIQGAVIVAFTFDTIIRLYVYSKTANAEG